mgnify:CR=1 FL=1
MFLFVIHLFTNKYILKDKTPYFGNTIYLLSYLYNFANIYKILELYTDR